MIKLKIWYQVILIATILIILFLLPACSAVSDPSSTEEKNTVGLASKRFIKNLPYWIRICQENCDTIPVPIIKICPTEQPNCQPMSKARVEYFLNNNPLITFEELVRIVYNNSGSQYFAEGYTIQIVDSKGLIELESNGPLSRLRSNGAYRVDILFDPILVDGNEVYLEFFFSRRQLHVGESAKIKFKMDYEKSNLGEARFFYRTESKFDSRLVFGKVKAITKAIDSTTLKKHIRYDISIMPSTLSHILGLEGNFYLGNGKIAADYQEVANITCYDMCAVLRYVENEVGHEYSHAIQFERDPDGMIIPFGCYREGLADALTVHLGYNSADKLLQETRIVEGCPISLMEERSEHALGRCIFGHLMQGDIFSDLFFKNLFNPNKKYEFENGCDLSVEKTCKNYMDLFDWASGQNTSDIMNDRIKGNC